MANTYDVGDLVRLSATFLASGGAPADPSTLFLVTKNAAAVASNQYGVTPSAIVRTGVGAYYLDLNVNQKGPWAYAWVGTGGVQVAEEGAFAVRDTFRL